MGMPTRLDDIEEDNKKINKVLFGDDGTSEKGIVADINFTRRLVRLIGYFGIFVLGVVVSLSITLLKYNFDLIQQVTRITVLLETHMGKQ